MSKEVIGVFTLAYRPFVGGAEIAIEEISRRIPDAQFVLFTSRFDATWPEREMSGNAEVIRVGKGRSGGNYYGRFLEKIVYVIRAWRAAEREHRQRPFAATWAMMASYAGIAALLFKLRHPDVPMLLTLQEGDSEEHILHRVGIFYPLWKLIFTKADRIQVISNYLGDFARRHGASCPIDMVPNGVDFGKFKTENQKPKNAGKKPVIITTSRLVHKNGIDIVIRAAAELKKTRGARFSMQVVGSGPDEQSLKNLAAELGVAENMEFLGHVEPERIPDYLSGADVFVRPSRSEGLGNSFLEAMAAGLPVIGTRAGGIPDFLKDGETGLFCEIDNPKDLAEKITYLLDNPDAARRIAANGRTLARGNYSWDGIASRMKNIFSMMHAPDRAPRILIATGIYPPDIGGPATYTVLLEKELPKRGLSVGVLAFTPFRKKPTIIRHFAYFRRCWSMLNNFDAVYAQDPVSVGLPAMLAAKLRGRKFFIRVAGDYAWEQATQRFGVSDSIDEFQHRRYGWKTELLRRIQRLVVGRADLVITPSRYFQKLVGGWVAQPEKVKTIYNGIELRGGVMAVRNNNVLLSVGRLVPWKGFDYLIKLMADPEMVESKLFIVGEGPDRTRLEEIIREYKLENRVTLVGEIGREKMLSNYLHNAGIFILNTSFESFSFAIVEAMNAHVPVIATKIGSIPELIEDGKEGILVEPNNKDQILSAIKKIRDDFGFRRDIGHAAHSKAQEFSIQRTVDNLVNLINEATG